MSDTLPSKPSKYVGLIAIDPGETTGIFSSLFSRNGELLYSQKFLTKHSECEFGQVSYSMADTIDDLTELSVCRGKLDIHVAIERFVITANTAKFTQQTTALEVTGVIKDICLRRSIPYYMQMKSQVAKISNNDLLKHIGWYRKGKPHAVDAARHAFYLLKYVDKNLFDKLWLSWYNETRSERS
jgi:flagellar biosynthesis/type III secretory pathway ATPase